MCYKDHKKQILAFTYKEDTGRKNLMQGRRAANNIFSPQRHQ